MVGCMLLGVSFEKHWKQMGYDSFRCCQKKTWENQTPLYIALGNRYIYIYIYIVYGIPW